MRHRPPRRGARGFTLVEVMVSLAVFALVSAAAVAILAWAADHQGRIRERMDRLAELQRAHALLKSDLSQVALRRIRQPNGALARNAFDAAPPGTHAGTLVAFVRRGWENPDGEARASLQYVEYRLVDDRLERSVRAALDGAPADTSQVVLTGVETMDLGFHSYRQWSDGWTGGAEALPDAVRFDMTLRDFGAVRQVFVLPEAAL